MFSSFLCQPIPGNFLTRMGADLNDQISAGFLMLLMVIIIFGNGLVLLAVSRYIRKITPPCVLIINLAVADLLMGVTLPLQAIVRLHETFAENNYACFLRFSSMVLSSFSSMFAVLLMALDRYFGVCRCISYHRSNSVWKTCIAVVVMWAYSLFLAIYPIYYFTETNSTVARECVVKYVISPAYLVFIPIQYFLVLFCIGFMYFKVFKAALNRRRVISVHLGFVLTSRVMRLQRELRAAKLMAAILIVFIFCWTPFAIVLLYDIASEGTDQLVLTLTDGAVFLGIINSAVNPVIYPLQNRDFKKAFREILSCVSQRERIIT